MSHKTNVPGDQDTSGPRNYKNKKPKNKEPKDKGPSNPVVNIKKAAKTQQFTAAANKK